MNNKITSIRVTKATVEQLKDEQKYPREPMEDVILRILSRYR